MKCYGKYTNEKECGECDLMSYCRESVYKPENNRVDLSEISNNEDLIRSTEHTGDAGKLSLMLSEMLHYIHHTSETDDERHRSIWDIIDELAKIYRQCPNTYKIILKKIIYPKKSYRVIAEEMNLSKEAVRYHIHKVLKTSEVIRAGILIDYRRHKYKK